ncbi:MAG: hypothetical protein ACSHYB_03245 [Roseibacillus sp.]
MFRRLSSLVLITFLTILVGAKDLALGFCLCEDALFLGKDPCSKTAPACSSCDHCCEEKEEPCDDCVVPLQLEVEDYLWSNDSYHFHTPVVAETEASFTAASLKSFPALQSHPTPIEPPPPQGYDILILQRRLLL